MKVLFSYRPLLVENEITCFQYVTVYDNNNTGGSQGFPVGTRHRFDVVTTSFGRQQRCYNVETTSCA